MYGVCVCVYISVGAYRNRNRPPLHEETICKIPTDNSILDKLYNGNILTVDVTN